MPDAQKPHNRVTEDPNGRGFRFVLMDGETAVLVTHSALQKLAGSRRLGPARLRAVRPELEKRAGEKYNNGERGLIVINETDI